jgi:hypothetical protein
MNRVLMVDMQGGVLFEDVTAPPRLRNEAKVMLHYALSALTPLLGSQPFVQALQDGDREVIECAEENLLSALEFWMQHSHPKPVEPAWLTRHSQTIKGHLADPMSGWTDIISPITAEYYRVRPEMIWGIVSFTIEHWWHPDLDEELHRRFRDFCARRPHPPCWDHQVHLYLTGDLRCQKLAYWSLNPHHLGNLIVVNDERN